MSRPEILPVLDEAGLAHLGQAESRLHTTPWNLTQFRESLASGHTIWQVRQEGELAAYAVVLNGPFEAELLTLGVLPEWQRQGLARALMDFLLERVREAGLEAMLLEVRAGNVPAIALYRKCGFEETGCRKAYYAAGDGREDALLMRRGLP